MLSLPGMVSGLLTGVLMMSSQLAYTVCKIHKPEVIGWILLCFASKGQAMKHLLACIVKNAEGWVSAKILASRRLIWDNRW